MLFNIKSHLFVAVLITFLSIGCSDDSPVIEPEPELEEHCHVNSYTSNWYMGDRSGNPSETKFTYDAQDRVVLAPAGSNQISFEYYEDKIVLKYANPAPNTVTDYYTLNDKGFIVHLKREWMAPWDTEFKDYLVLDFVYDDEGYLTEIKENDNKITFNYENSNLTKIHDGLNGRNDDILLTYYPDTEYAAVPIHSVTPLYHVGSLHRTPTPINNTVGMAVLSNGGYFGKLSKNRIKTIGTYELIYGSDDEKNVNKIKEVNSSESIDSMVYHIDYKCF
ncbi:DUF4595 domain-containing protein [Sphingobacterium sp. UDSM-2020]|uniref:DUF4595 domain-containing protein n=1 Tax=Sphingobacterium sp. UDSM-2020 TaxID=2795738 RepID=UPI0019357A35|nr:DUF4595 domain-containing protein [Sphingobacterium sp. UDSM-2020]QQD14406.1 DUF4595 domain-containing protein [Sphingobacterium sp. UDSM-2020]